jgi:hypothetical protein
MTDSPHDPDLEHTVDGGGGPTEDPRMQAIRAAAARLELLSPDTRETILARMDASVADDIRRYLESMPDRPHAKFSGDLAERRRLLQQTANSLQARQIEATDRDVERLARDAARPQPSAANAGSNLGPGAAPAAPAHDAAAIDPLDRLRELHPAAIARAMQGERAEAWAIVLDRLEDNSRAALQLYLDPTARTAIEEARDRQAELARTSPALLATVIAAIARTVVPRAMREHQQLLSTTPLAWNGVPA